jgi:hypothetical protein
MSEWQLCTFKERERNQFNGNNNKNKIKTMNTFITATHNTTHGCINEGIPSKTELTDGSAAVSSAILETPEDDHCWSKHILCIHQ